MSTPELSKMRVHARTFSLKHNIDELPAL
jgi:hypothetical protein